MRPLWHVNSKLRLQSTRCQWQRLSIHLWAYCNPPIDHYMKDTWCVKGRQHDGGLTSPTLSKQKCRFLCPLQFWLMKEGWRRQGSDAPKMGLSKLRQGLKSHASIISSVFWKDPGCCFQPGFEPMTSHSAGQCSPNWANWAAVLVSLYWAAGQEYWAATCLSLRVGP